MCGEVSDTQMKERCEVRTHLASGNYAEIQNARASQMKLVVKNLPINAGDVRDAVLIPGLGRSPGVVNGNPFQYSCLENSKDRGVRWGHKESETTEHTHSEPDSSPNHWIRSPGWPVYSPLICSPLSTWSDFFFLTINSPM